MPYHLDWRNQHESSPQELTPKLQGVDASEATFRHEGRSCENRHENVNRHLGVNLAFEIRPSLNKGLGVFAIRPIPRASIIMRDRIVLRYDRREELQQIYHRVERLPRPILEEVLKLVAVRDVGRSMAVGHYLLSKGVRQDVIPRIMHLVDILKTNTFATHVEGSQLPAALCLTASRINHSCVPNTDHFHGDKSNWMSFVANRDITEGEEITISYIEHLEQRTERRRKLLRNWAIDCQCPGCDLNHPDTHAHEYRLKRIALLDQDPSKDVRGRLTADKSRARNVLEDAAVWSRKRIKLLSSHSSFQEHLHQA